MDALSKYEQETIINFNAAEKTAEVYTADHNVINKLDKLVVKYPEQYKVQTQDEYSKTYLISSKKLIAFKKPLILTDEQKEERRKRLNNIRKGQE